MGSGVKEDEKNEKIIRGLLKQPGNRKCINCNILGPQYVCTTFSTFVCTTCGGIHREFTHRVKSVSMAKFTPQEIAALQAGGNELAKEIFFKDWDPQRQSAPDSSNVDKLRDFIKHVYVDRRYSGERSVDRPPRVEMGDKEEPIESRSDSYQSGPRSPPFDEAYERRYSGSSSPYYGVRRSPGSEQDNQRHSDYGRSPIHSGVVNDWWREDRFSNGRKSEDRRSSDGESKSGIRSPDSQKDSSVSSPPVVRPVREILGDNVVPLRIGEPPKANSSRVADGATLTQRTASSSSFVSSNGNPTEPRQETSLIDFDADPEPSMTAAAVQGQQSIVEQSVTQSTSTPSDNNWACFDNFVENKVSQAPPNSHQLESMLTELSVPAPAPVSGAASTPSNGLFPSASSRDLLVKSVGNTSTAALSGAPGASPTGSFLSFPFGGVAAAPGLAPPLPATGGTAQQLGMQSQHQPSVGGNQPPVPQLVSSYPSGPSSQGVMGNPVAQALPAVAQAPQAIPVNAAQNLEAKSGGRTELPADLFTGTYSSIPYQIAGWQAGLVPCMGYHMQYNTAMSIPTFPQPTISHLTKSANPFNVNAEASPAQAAAFPSMTSLHMALPNMVAPGGSVHAPNLDGARPSWMPHQSSSYPSAMLPSAQSFGSAMAGTYTGQQQHNNMMPSGPQGFGSFGNGGTFGSANPSAATPNPSLGGNPFG